MNIKLHSVTDLITNSSTTIYTFSEKSEVAFKLLVNEFLKTLGVNKTCDDVFTVAITPNGWDRHWDYARYDGDYDLKRWATDLGYDKFNGYMDDVFLNKLPKPDWLQEMEDEWGNSGPPGTVLKISAKSPEYETLAKLFTDFLYSTDSREVHD